MKKLTFFLTLFLLLGSFSTAIALSPVNIRTDHNAVSVTIVDDHASRADITTGLVIGTITGINHTQFTVRAAAITDVFTNQSQKGVFVEVKRSKGMVVYRHSTFIDYDHLVKLIEWLNKLNQTKADTTLPFEMVANLKFKGVLGLDVVNTVDRTMIKVKSGESENHVAYFNDIMVLLQMETYFATAQTKLDAMAK